MLTSTDWSTASRASGGTSPSMSSPDRPWTGPRQEVDALAPAQEAGGIHLVEGLAQLRVDVVGVAARHLGRGVLRVVRAERSEGVPEQVRLVDGEVDVRLPDGSHPADQRAVVVAVHGAHRAVDTLVEELGSPVTDLVEQGVLVREVVVGRTRADADGLGDTPQRHLLGALGAHAVERLRHEGLGEVAVVVRGRAAVRGQR